MDLGSILLIFALLLLVGIFVSRPLLDRKTRSVTLEADLEDHQRSALMAERDRILNAIQELDFDHALGKIPAEVYPQQRETLLSKGAEVLRSLDELDSSFQTRATQDHLESMIAAHRDQVSEALPSVDGDGLGKELKSTKPVAIPDDDVEALLANRRRARQGKSAGFCPQCGRPLQKTDRFCPKCGYKMS